MGGSASVCVVRHRGFEPQTPLDQVARAHNQIEAQWQDRHICFEVYAAWEYDVYGNYMDIVHKEC